MLYSPSSYLVRLCLSLDPTDIRRYSPIQICKSNGMAGGELAENLH